MWGKTNAGEVLGKLLNLRCLSLPSCNGYLVERKMDSVWLKLPAYVYVCALYSLRGDERVYVGVPIPGKVRRLNMDIDNRL